jgi:hypothetical protein
MANIYDDGMSAWKLALALAAADEIADEERNQCDSEEEEPLSPDEDAPEWYEEN